MRKPLINCRYVGRPRRNRVQEEVGVGLQSVQEDVIRWWCRCRVYIERLQRAELPLRSFYHWSIKHFNTCVHTYTNTSLASQTHFRKRGFARLHKHTQTHSTTYVIMLRRRELGSGGGAAISLCKTISWLTVVHNSVIIHMCRCTQNDWNVPCGLDHDNHDTHTHTLYHVCNNTA